MFGPAVHAGLEEGAIDDQLPPAVEQVEQTRLALGPVELVLLLHGLPRHPPTLGGQRVTGAGQLLLLHEQLLARSLPLLRRDDRGCLHEMSSFVGSGPTLICQPAFQALCLSVDTLCFCECRILALAVLVVAAPPETSLVASLGRAVEPLVHAPEAIQSARIGGIGVVDDAVLKRESAHARPLVKKSGRV